MAITAEQKLQNAIIVTKNVKLNSTATLGKCGKYDSSDETTVLDCAAGDKPDVIFLETKASSASAQTVQCLPVGAGGGGCVVQVKVGTGGATAGNFGVVVSDGLTDQSLTSGSTLRHLAGKFTQTGVVGDLVGFAPGPFAIFTA